MEIAVISSIVLTVLTGLGYIFHQIHLKNCECLCVKSSCFGSTPPTTPDMKHLLSLPII